MVSAPIVYNLSIKDSFCIWAFKNDVLSADLGSLKDWNLSPKIMLFKSH